MVYFCILKSYDWHYRSLLKQIYLVKKNIFLKLKKVRFKTNGVCLKIGTVFYLKYFQPQKYLGRYSVAKPLKKDVNYLHLAKYIEIKKRWFTLC